LRIYGNYIKIVNNKLSYKTKDRAKAKVYNSVEEKKVLGKNIIENISFRKGTNPLKKSNKVIGNIGKSPNTNLNQRCNCGIILHVGFSVQILNFTLS